MDWTPVSYAYDGSFAGFLTCVFASYAHREEPMSFSTPEDGGFPSAGRSGGHRRDPRQPGVPLPGPQAGAGGAAAGGVRLSHLPGGAGAPPVAVSPPGVRPGAVGGAGSHRRPGGSADPRGGPPDRRGSSAQGLHTLLRAGGGAGGGNCPQNRVLPLLRPHFCARYPEESFVLYDRTHREALFYRPRRWAIVPLEAFRAAAPGREERDFRRLWRRFYDTIAIEGRENPRCRMTQMPKRFWGTMTEFQNEPEERKELAP